MLELSLFSGVGGGLLASQLLGWMPIGYVEHNDYCQRIIAARIADGLLPEAPIFGDLQAFNRQGYAFRYRGVAEVVTAGFPCQPWSAAGRRLGADDARNLWPETAETLRLVRPRWALLENVPGLLGSHGYYGRVLGDLAELGYDARWGVLGADACGAPHRRKRLWIVAADSQRHQLRIEPGRSSRTHREGETQPAVHGQEGTLANAAGPGQQIVRRGEVRTKQLGRGAACGGRWWDAEPNVDRVAHGVASRVDRLRALGNGQVPAVAVAAWGLLNACRRADSPTAR